MIRVFRSHLALVSVVVASLALFFAGHFAARAVWFAQPREQAVAGWMTVGYVGRSWGFDPREIDARAGLPLPEKGRPFTLEEIARDRGVPMADVEAALEALRAGRRAERGLVAGVIASPLRYG